MEPVFGVRRARCGAPAASEACKRAAQRRPPGTAGGRGANEGEMSAQPERPGRPGDRCLRRRPPLLSWKPATRRRSELRPQPIFTYAQPTPRRKLPAKCLKVPGAGFHLRFPWLSREDRPASLSLACYGARGFCGLCSGRPQRSSIRGWRCACRNGGRPGRWRGYSGSRRPGVVCPRNAFPASGERSDVGLCLIELGSAVRARSAAGLRRYF